jgi:flagellar protein FliO/FliZ
MLYARAVFALVFVIGLIFLSAALAKRYGLDKRIAGNNKLPRQMEVMETLYLDPKNKLVLVCCSGKEHLLLLGSAGNLLIESDKKGMGS